MQMTTEQEDRQLAEHLARRLRDSEADIDELTAARLQAARRRALDMAGRRRLSHRLGWSAGGFATAAVVIMAVMLWNTAETPEPALFDDDWDMLAEGDLQLIEELEFYDWLPEEDTAG
jgi:hypothetical protein